MNFTGRFRRIFNSGATQQQAAASPTSAASAIGGVGARTEGGQRRTADEVNQNPSAVSDNDSGSIRYVSAASQPAESGVDSSAQQEGIPNKSSPEQRLKNAKKLDERFYARTVKEFLDSVENGIDEKEFDRGLRNIRYKREDWVAEHGEPKFVAKQEPEISDKDIGYGAMGRAAQEALANMEKLRSKQHRDTTQPSNVTDQNQLRRSPELAVKGNELEDAKQGKDAAQSSAGVQQPRTAGGHEEISSGVRRRIDSDRIRENREHRLGGVFEDRDLLELAEYREPVDALPREGRSSGDYAEIPLQNPQNAHVSVFHKPVPQPRTLKQSKQEQTAVSASAAVVTIPPKPSISPKPVTAAKPSPHSRLNPITPKHQSTGAKQPLQPVRLKEGLLKGLPPKHLKEIAAREIQQEQARKVSKLRKKLATIKEEDELNALKEQKVDVCKEQEEVEKQQQACQQQIKEKEAKQKATFRQEEAINLEALKQQEIALRKRQEELEKQRQILQQQIQHEEQALQAASAASDS